jgi:hypothetical protein
MRALLTAVLLFSSQGFAQAQEASTNSQVAPTASAPAAEAQAPKENSLEPPLSQWGAQLDVGVLDGVGLSGVYRPIRWFRASAGLTYNLMSFGLRAGVSLVPFHFVVTPSLNFDLGMYFPGDANRILDLVGADVDEDMKEPLRDIGYQYANAHLGIEVGSPGKFIFFLRAGLTYFQTSVKNLDVLAKSSGDDSSVTMEPVSVRGTVPSAKLGFLYYF